MNESSRAWLLSVSPQLQIAVARHEVIEYLADVIFHFVPTSQAHSCNVIFWRDQIVPVVSLMALAGLDDTEEYSTVAVLAYQEAPKDPLKYVGLYINSAPESIDVVDDAVCEWPEESSEVIGALLKTAFSRLDQAIGILDIQVLCSLEF